MLKFTLNLQLIGANACTVYSLRHIILIYSLNEWKNGLQVFYLWMRVIRRDGWKVSTAT
jgi:hypothetical protein